MAVMVCQGLVIEDSGATFLARIHGAAGTAITQASVASISWKVFTLEDPATVVLSGTATPAANIYDTLQTDAIWTEDSTGYNFRYDMAALAFPTGNLRYRVTFRFVPATGEVFHLLYEVDALQVYSS